MQRGNTAINQSRTNNYPLALLIMILQTNHETNPDIMTEMETWLRMFNGAKRIPRHRQSCIIGIR